MAFSWQKLQPGFVCLAPMEGVTDTSFRQVMLRRGKPDVLFTEFTSVDGLVSRGFEKVAKSLQYTQEERPIVAQIWGVKVENFYKVGKILVDMGFDGVDINMGCPVKAVVKKGACSALIRNPKKAVAIVEAVKEGVEGKMPVSVKTRIGFDEIVTQWWSQVLLSCDIDALIMHGRTSEEMSQVPCHWDEISKVVDLRDQMGKQTVIVGNGDVVSLEQAREMVEKYKVDGVMIGRGVFADPWVFNEIESIAQKSKEEKLAAYREHIEIFTSVWGRGKGFERLKRFAKVYVVDFPGSTKLRDEIMRAKTLGEMEELLVISPSTSSG